MKVLITGITGSLGAYVSRICLAQNLEVIGYSRDELKQQQFPKHPNLKLYLGDVRDRDRLRFASRKCDTIFHFAALKHVDKLQENPDEALKTNVEGTDNVLAAQRDNGIFRVVLASTDKAVFPINSYGKSKALAEDLVLRNPHNVVCRYGNVLGSRGSVLQTFRDGLLSDEKELVFTDTKMSRFWWTVSDAANFVYNASIESEGLCIPDQRACSVVRLGVALAKRLKVSAFKTREIGIRPGEKLHEYLDENRCSNMEHLQMDDNEIDDLLERAL